MKTLHDGTEVEDSVPTKNVSGARYLLTEQEIAERAAEESKALKEKPLKEWQSQIAATDSKIPRAIEDIIDALDAPTKAKIAKQTLDLYEREKDNPRPKT